MMYLNPVRLTDKFPSAYPSIVKDRHPGAEADELTAIWLERVVSEIIHYSGYIDSSVGERYPMRGGSKFPAWDDSPSTPNIISEICYLLCYASLIDYFRPVKTGDESEETTTYKDRAEQMLKDIRSGDRIVDGYVTKVAGASVARENVMTPENFSGFSR